MEERSNAKIYIYDAARLQFMTEMGGVVSIHYAFR
jgi:hypothetical protein